MCLLSLLTVCITEAKVLNRNLNRAPKLCFTVLLQLLQTREQKRQSHLSDSFWRSASNKKNPNPRRFKWCFYVWRFSRRCAHSHWRPLFSHEALNVGVYRAWNTSLCVRALRCIFFLFCCSTSGAENYFSVCMCVDWWLQTECIL